MGKYVEGDSGGDIGGDSHDVRGDSQETRWMTYAELAQARGIKEPAAVRLVQRRGWERHTGNDGSARIAVPLPELRPSRAVTPVVLRVAPHVVGDIHDVGGDSQIEREWLRASEAEARAERAEVRETQARAEVREIRREYDKAREEREEARVRAASAEGEARALREALVEARRPGWRRWIGLP